MSILLFLLIFSDLEKRHVFVLRMFSPFLRNFLFISRVVLIIITIFSLVLVFVLVLIKV